MTEIVIRELAYYEALAAENHRGLVAMTFQENAMPWLVGDTAGFTPRDARAMHGKGQAVPAVELEQTEDHFASLSRTGGTAMERQALAGDEIERLNGIDVSPTIFAETKLAQIALAKRIKGLGQREGGINGEMAAEIIRAELSRRGQSLSTDDATRGEALQQRTGGALTSESGTGPDPAGAGGQPPVPDAT
jgi:hypothetical protein